MVRELVTKSNRPPPPPLICKVKRGSYHIVRFFYFFRMKYKLRTHGDCLDSELSPIRIKDGDTLLAYTLDDWKANDEALSKYVGRIVGVAFKRGGGLVKILEKYDRKNRLVYLRQVNPNMVMCFSLSEIKDILIVEGLADE